MRKQSFGPVCSVTHRTHRAKWPLTYYAHNKTKKKDKQNKHAKFMVTRVLSRHLLGGKVPPPNLATSPPPRIFGQL